MYYVIACYLIVLVSITSRTPLATAAAPATAVASSAASAAVAGKQPTTSTGAASPTGGREEEYCLRDTFNVTCSHDEVILMTSASYGRMGSGRCISGNFGHIGCMAEVTSHLDDECSGKQSCLFPVSTLLKLSTPCPNDVTSYMLASYSCVKVITQTRCSHEGFSSSNTGDGGVGGGGVLLPHSGDGFLQPLRFTPRCPWKISVDPHQKLKFTLFNFDLHGRRNHPPGASHGSAGTAVGSGAGSAYQAGSSRCPWSLAFEEQSRGGIVEESMCQMTTRDAVFYTSSTHAVTVYVTHKHGVGLPSNFLLKYEALGCPRIRVPNNAWVVRQDETTARVKCNFTEETWFLACNERQWNGELGNCSIEKHEDAAAVDLTQSRGGAVNALPIGFVLAVIVGVLLGVVIGAIPLALVYACLRRKWRGQQTLASVYGVRGTNGSIYYPDIQHPLTGQEGGDCRAFYPSLLKKSAKSTDSGAMDCGGGGGMTMMRGEHCYGYADPYPLDTVQIGGPSCCAGHHIHGLVGNNERSPTEFTTMTTRHPWNELSPEAQQEQLLLETGNRCLTPPDCCIRQIIADECPDVTCSAATKHVTMPGSAVITPCSGGGQGGHGGIAGSGRGHGQNKRPVTCDSHVYESASFSKTNNINSAPNATGSGAVVAGSEGRTSLPTDTMSYYDGDVMCGVETKRCYGSQKAEGKSRTSGQTTLRILDG